MATNKQKLIRRDGVSLKTPWLDNAMKSIGATTNSVFSQLYPNLMDVTGAGLKTTKTLITTIRQGKANTNRVTATLKQNKYIQASSQALKNALKDFKSGNIAGHEESFDDFFGGMSDNSDVTFGEDDVGGESAGGESYNINVDDGTRDAVLRLQDSFDKQAKTTVELNKANMDAQLSINAMQMQQISSMTAEITGHLSNISNSLESIAKFNTENMQKFIDSSVAYYEAMGAKSEGGATILNSEELDAISMMRDSRGGINMNQYKELVKKQAKKALDDVPLLGEIVGQIDDSFLEMFAKNPLGLVSSMMGPAIVTKLMGSTLTGVETAMQNFLPTMLDKIAAIGEEEAEGFSGAVKKYLAQTFGVKIDTKNSLSVTKMENRPVPFDNETKTAITEIITKELREQTEYLRIIAEKHNKKAAQGAKENSEMFDYSTMKYIKVKDKRRTTADELMNEIMRPLTSDSKFFQTFTQAVKGSTDNKGDQEALIQAAQQLLKAMSESGPGLNIHDTRNKQYTDAIEKAKKTAGNKNINAVVNAFSKIAEENPAIADQLTAQLLSSRKNKNNVIKQMMSDPTRYGLIATGDNEIEDVDEWLRQNSTLFNTAMKSSIRSSTKKRLGNADFSPTPNGNANTGLIGNLFKNGADSVTNTLNGIMSGRINFDNIGGEFGKIFKSGAKDIGESLKLNIFNPLKESILGIKDDSTGKYNNGLLSSIRNSLSDTFSHIKYTLTGHEYTDSNGTTYSENNDSIFGTVKRGILSKLLGPEELDENGNPTGERSGGLFSKIKDAFNSGLRGWQEKFIGEPLDDKSEEEIQKKMTEKLNSYTKNATVGGAIGAGVGMFAGSSLLGTLVGGPIGGVGLGIAAGLLSKNERIQNWLFGEKDENGERTGGFISKGVQDYVKKHKLDIAGGAAIGGLMSALTGKGVGVLGTFIGGPLVGAGLGVATTLVARSERFKNFLFGNEETAQKGLIPGIREAFKKGTSKFTGEMGVNLSADSKVLGMSGLGILGGVMASAILPGGPIFGGLLGLGASIAANGKTFSKYLFGEDYVDEATGEKKHKHGLFGRVGNMINANFLRPMKTQLSYWAKQSLLDLEYTVGDSISFLAEGIAEKVGDVVGTVKAKFDEVANNISGFLKENILNPFAEILNNAIVTPIKKVVSGAATIVYEFNRRVVLAPFRIIQKAQSFIYSKIAEAWRNSPLNAALDAGKDWLKTTVKKEIKWVGRRIVGLTKLALSPFRLAMKGIGTALTLAAHGAKKGASWIARSKFGQAIGFSASEHNGPYDTEKMSRAERWRARRARSKEERQKLKDEYKAQKTRDKNAKIIQKYTKGQYSSDTAEARYMAKIMSGGKAAKLLDTSVETEDAVTRRAREQTNGVSLIGKGFKDIDKIPFSKLSENAQITFVLKKIYDQITGNNDDDENAPESEKDLERYYGSVTASEREKGHKELSEIIKNHTDENGNVDYDAVEADVANSSSENTAGLQYALSATKVKLAQAGAKKESILKAATNRRFGDEVDMHGGVKGYLRHKFNEGILNITSIAEKDVYDNRSSQARSKVISKLRKLLSKHIIYINPGESIPKIADRVLETGVLRNIDGDKIDLDGNLINDNDDSSMGLSAEYKKYSKGPVAESDDAKFGTSFEDSTKYNDSSESNPIMKLRNRIKQSEVRLRNKGRSNMIANGGEGGGRGDESAAAIGAAAQESPIVVNNISTPVKATGDMGQRRADRILNAERNEQRSIFTAIRENTKTIKEKASSHFESWKSVFGKKGKIATALLLASPFIVKAFKWLASSPIGQVITNIKNTLTGDGTFGEKLTDIAEQLNPINAIGKFIENRKKDYEEIKEKGLFNWADDKLTKSKIGEYYTTGKHIISAWATVAGSIGPAFVNFVKEVDWENVASLLDSAATKLGGLVNTIVGWFSGDKEETNGEGVVVTAAKDIKDDVKSISKGDVGGYLTDHNDNWTEMSDAKSKILMNPAATRATLNAVPAASQAAGKALTTVGKGLTKIPTKGTVILGGATRLAGGTVGFAGNVAEGVKLGIDDYKWLHTISKTRAVDQSRVSWITEICTFKFQELIDLIGKTLAKKFPTFSKVIGTGFNAIFNNSIIKDATKLLSNLVKNSAIYKKLSAGVTKLFAGHVKMISPEGLLLELGLTVSGTINALISNSEGGMAAAQLFKIPPGVTVDDTMKAISTVFMTITSTTLGSFLYLIATIIKTYSPNHYDLLHNLAVKLYTTLVGKDSDEVKKLKKNQERWKSEFLESLRPIYKNKYEEMMSKGLIDKDVDIDTFSEKYNNGDYDKIMEENNIDIIYHRSFDDWNEHENQTYGSYLGETTFTGSGGVSKVLSTVFANDKYNKAKRKSMMMDGASIKAINQTERTGYVKTTGYYNTDGSFFAEYTDKNAVVHFGYFDRDMNFVASLTPEEENEVMARVRAGELEVGDAYVTKTGWNAFWSDEAADQKDKLEAIVFGGDSYNDKRRTEMEASGKSNKEINQTEKIGFVKSTGYYEQDGSFYADYLDKASGSTKFGYFDEYGNFVKALSPEEENKVMARIRVGELETGDCYVDRTAWGNFMDEFKTDFTESFIETEDNGHTAFYNALFGYGNWDNPINEGIVNTTESIVDTFKPSHIGYKKTYGYYGPDNSFYCEFTNKEGKTNYYAKYNKEGNFERLISKSEWSDVVLGAKSGYYEWGYNYVERNAWGDMLDSVKDAVIDPIVEDASIVVDSVKDFGKATFSGNADNVWRNFLDTAVETTADTGKSIFDPNSDSGWRNFWDTAVETTADTGKSIFDPNADNGWRNFWDSVGETLVDEGKGVANFFKAGFDPNSDSKFRKFNDEMVEGIAEFFTDTDGPVRVVKVIDDFFSSHKEQVWVDENGVYYVANGDDMFDIYNCVDEKIGEIDRDSVIKRAATGELIKSEKTIQSGLSKLFTDNPIVNGAMEFWETSINDIKNKWKSFIDERKEKKRREEEAEKRENNYVDNLKDGQVAWVDYDMSYYMLDESGTSYDHYSAIGTLFESNISLDFVNNRIKSGYLVKGTPAPKGIADKVGNTLKDIWGSIEETAEEGWSNFLEGWGLGGSGSGKKTTNNPTKVNNTGGNGDKNIVQGGRGYDEINGMPYYSQSDSAWSSNRYGTDGATMNDSGCGPTAMSMVASKMTGRRVLPTETASLAEITGDRDETGTNWNFIDKASAAYGISSSEQYNPSSEFISSELRSGKPMILSGASGEGHYIGGRGNTPYTDAGHYVVATGIDSSGNVDISDPRGKSYSKKYKLDDIVNQTGKAWSFGQGGYGGGYGTKLSGKYNGTLERDSNGGYNYINGDFSRSWSASTPRKNIDTEIDWLDRLITKLEKNKTSDGQYKYKNSKYNIDKTYDKSKSLNDVVADIETRKNSKRFDEKYLTRDSNGNYIYNDGYLDVSFPNSMTKDDVINALKEKGVNVSGTSSEKTKEEIHREHIEFLKNHVDTRLADFTLDVYNNGPDVGLPMGHCTTYAESRAFERGKWKGRFDQPMGNGGEVYDEATRKGYDTGTTIADDAMLSIDTGSAFGHLVYIEGYDEETDNVYWTEANGDGQANGVSWRDTYSNNIPPDGYLRVTPKKDFPLYGGKEKGYIYVSDASTYDGETTSSDSNSNSNNSDSDSSTSSTISNSSSNNKDSKPSVLDFISQMFSRVGTTLINGMFTGKFDTDFSDIMSGINGNNSSSGITNTTNISGNSSSSSSNSSSNSSSSSGEDNRSDSLTSGAKGIDISKWQVNCDYEKIKADGIEFAMIKIGEGLAVDPEFETHYNGCLKAGIHVGGYYFIQANNESEAIQEAKHCLSTIKGKKFDMPIAYDVEDFPDNIGTENLSKIVDAFCTTIKNAGYYPMIYGAESACFDYITKAIQNKYDLWVAHWGVQPKLPWKMWQYGGDQGTLYYVKGITGHVDMDKCVYDYPTYIMSHGLNGYEKGEKNSDHNKKEDARENTLSGVSSTTNNSSAIFVGDSRTVGLYISIDNAAGSTMDAIGETMKDGNIIVASVGKGLPWFNSSTIREKIVSLGKGRTSSKIIIWLGFNDIHGAPSSLALADIARNYVYNATEIANSAGNDIYFISVGPRASKDDDNSDVKKFNEALKNAVNSGGKGGGRGPKDKSTTTSTSNKSNDSSSNKSKSSSSSSSSSTSSSDTKKTGKIKYIDLESWFLEQVKNGGIQPNGSDTIHYTVDSYKLIYDKILSSVGASGGSGRAKIGGRGLGLPQLAFNKNGGGFGSISSTSSPLSLVSGKGYSGKKNGGGFGHNTPHNNRLLRYGGFGDKDESEKDSKSSSSSSSGSANHEEHIKQLEAAVGQRLADFSSPAYTSENNLSGGQCTWYAEGRAYERSKWDGLHKQPMGNGGEVYANAKSKGMPTGSEPADDSLVSITNGSYGHVMYVEGVDNANNKIYYTEANNPVDNAISAEDGQLKVMSFSDWNNQSIAGYVYTDGSSSPISTNGSTTGDSSSSSSTSGNSSSSSTAARGLEYVAAVLGEASSRMANAMFTGELDPDFSNLNASSSSSSSSSSSNTSNSTSGDSSGTSVSGDGVHEQVWNALIKNNYSNAATAGIMGNIEQESGFRPGVYSNDGGGGLVQWTPWQTKIGAYSVKKGKGELGWRDDVQMQMDYLDESLNELGDWESAAGISLADFKRSTDPEAAAIQFEKGYERPGIPRTENRTAAARKYYNQYAGGGNKDGGKGKGFGNGLGGLGGGSASLRNNKNSGKASTKSTSDKVNKYVDDILKQGKKKYKTGGRGSSMQNGMSIESQLLDGNLTTDIYNRTNRVTNNVNTNNNQIDPAMMSKIIELLNSIVTNTYNTSNGINGLNTNNQNIINNNNTILNGGNESSGYKPNTSALSDVSRNTIIARRIAQGL